MVLELDFADELFYLTRLRREEERQPLPQLASERAAIRGVVLHVEARDTRRAGPTAPEDELERRHHRRLVPEQRDEKIAAGDELLAEQGFVAAPAYGFHARRELRTAPHQRALRDAVGTVAELGFGTGLNVIALLDLWRREGPAGGRLHVFSIEAFPLTADEAGRALSAWPELADIARPLLDAWPAVTTCSTWSK